MDYLIISRNSVLAKRYPVMKRKPIDFKRIKRMGKKLTVCIETDVDVQRLEQEEGIHINIILNKFKEVDVDNKDYVVLIRRWQMINYEISRNKGDLDRHIFSHGEGCLLVYNDIKCDRTFVSVTSILISSILEYFVDWDSIHRLNDLDSHLALAKGLDALVYQVEKLCNQ